MNSDNLNNRVEPMNTHHHGNRRCISWSAIIVGAVIAVSLSFLLNLLSLGIGLTAFPSINNGTSGVTLAVGGFVGLIIFAILAMFPAGFVAGLLGNNSCATRRMGEIYGAASWGLALIITILLASSISQFVSQSGYLVNRQQTVTIRMTDLPNNEIVRTNQNTNQHATVVVDPEKAAEAAGTAAFATFCMLFLGFIAACFGGRCGMMCRVKNLARHSHNPYCDMGQKK